MIRNELGYCANGNVAPGSGKECHSVVNLYLKRRSSSKIHYDLTGKISNKIFALYVVPYDSFGSLTTDNVASMSYFYRMYFKDV